MAEGAEGAAEEFPPGNPGFDAPVKSAVEVRGNRGNIPGIQGFPDRALPTGEFPAGATQGDMAFEDGHGLRFQFAGAVIEQQLRVIPSLQRAIHRSLAFTPYAPGARAGFRRRGRAAISPPTPSNTKPWRFENTPSLHTCASGLPLSAFAAAPQWRAGFPAAWPGTPWTAPPTAGGRKPA